MKNRIAETFELCQPFIGYLTGGDGGVDYSVACAEALIDGGVNILEIGYPFSDPVADGPVIQRAHARALEHGTNGESILEIGCRLRQISEAPMILFSYYNPLLQKGENYLRNLKEAGFDAVLVVDLAVPSRDLSSEPFFEALIDSKLLPICLATPSTKESRLSDIMHVGKGFLYYVSQKGTTGVRSQLADDFALQLTRLRQHTKLPIGAGFGIADRCSAKAALEYADGFVVGSAFVRLMEQRVDPSELKLLAESIDPREDIKGQKL